MKNDAIVTKRIDSKEKGCNHYDRSLLKLGSGRQEPCLGQVPVTKSEIPIHPLPRVGKMQFYW